MKSLPKQIVPSPVPIHIIYEDEDLMILDKEANQPIHPSINNYDNTLANGLAWYFSQKKEPLCLSLYQSS